MADASTGRVEIYSTSGTLLGPLSGQSGHPLQIMDPTAVAIGKGGSLYVADAGRHRVLKFVLAD